MNNQTSAPSDKLLTTDDCYLIAHGLAFYQLILPGEDNAGIKAVSLELYNFAASYLAEEKFDKSDYPSSHFVYDPSFDVPLKTVLEFYQLKTDWTYHRYSQEIASLLKMLETIYSSRVFIDPFKIDHGKA